MEPTNSSVETKEKNGEIDDESNFMNDIETRKAIYGVCTECDNPFTGDSWCQKCNAKRFKENFKNWTSGNKNIDEFIQEQQLNAVHWTRCCEWIPFEKFQNVTYISRGGFGKVFKANWLEGYIRSWNVQKQKWNRYNNHSYKEVALKCLDNSNNISKDFLNEVKTYYQIYGSSYIVQCYGITKEPETNNYMMVLQYFYKGNLRENLHKLYNINYSEKLMVLHQISIGLKNIHNAGKVHKDFHSGNILFGNNVSISDLGMCQPADYQSEGDDGIFGVLPYIAPEVIRGRQYTKSSDIYSFGIVMNEYLSGVVPFNNISHNFSLACNICKGLRPEIPDYLPKLFAELIMKCWNAEPENRPTVEELCRLINELRLKLDYKDAEICNQIEESERIRFNEQVKNKFKQVQHPQAIYTSRFLNYRSLPNPMTSSYKISQDIIQFISTSQNSEIQFIEQELIK
ncbi:kinase-like domain-containing protein [Rhizophagus diaphanus]|nr:kinase-like domain-containing protein [Rhizophagus diaphanus] [Rhizophagus sp. MUCL 43196]